MPEATTVRRVPTNVVLALALALGFLTSHAGAGVLRVGPGAYKTIGEALEAAAPGDEIHVASGNYRENLVIEQSVVLLGQGKAHVVGLGEGDVVRVMGDDVEMRGFSISGSGNDMLVSDAGIKIFGTRARVIGNRIYDSLFGVYLRGCTESLVENNWIRGRVEVEVGRRGAGIHFFDAHHNIVRGNDIALVRDGVYFDHADFNTVEDNEFAQLRYGVHYMYCKDNHF